MKSFEQVTRTTQRKWLRQLGERALQEYGIEAPNLRFVSDTSAVVFRVEAAGQQYALRINPEPLDDRWITWTEAELLWLNALRRDTDLSVPEPVAALDGTGVQIVTTRNIPDGRLVSLLRWLPGKKIGNRPLPELARQIGAFLAQLHRHTEAFALPATIDRPHTQWDKLHYWQDPRNDTTDTLTAAQRNLCAVASERLLAEINQIGAEQDYGLVHADLTLKNCLLHQNRLRVIDFGDTRYASHFYDIAVPLTDFSEYWTIKHDMYERLRATFYEGYSAVRSLGSRYKSAVETFMVARAFDVVEWIHLDWPSPSYFSFGPELLAQSLHRIKKYMQ